MTYVFVRSYLLTEMVIHQAKQRKELCLVYFIIFSIWNKNHTDMEMASPIV